MTENKENLHFHSLDGLNQPSNNNVKLPRPSEEAIRRQMRDIIAAKAEKAAISQQSKSEDAQNRSEQTSKNGDFTTNPNFILIVGAIFFAAFIGIFCTIPNFNWPPYIVFGSGCYSMLLAWRLRRYCDDKIIEAKPKEPEIFEISSINGI